MFITVILTICVLWSLFIGLCPTPMLVLICLGGAARTVFEMAGYTDLTAKIYGSTDKINVARATLNGLKSLRTKEQVALLRGKSVEEI